MYNIYMENLTIRKAVESDMEIINECIHGYDLNASDVKAEECFVAVAVTADNEMAGFVRMVEVDGLHELNLIAVVEGFKSKGVGRKMLEYVASNYSDHRIYILTTMEEFFGKFGFKRIDNPQGSEKDALYRIRGANENRGVNAVFMVLS